MSRENQKRKIKSLVGAVADVLLNKHRDHGGGSGGGGTTAPKPSGGTASSTSPKADAVAKKLLAKDPAKLTLSELTKLETIVPATQFKPVYQAKALAVAKSVAKKHLAHETLETRNNDNLDFREEAVWSVKSALMDAYKEGAGRAPKKKGMDALKRLAKKHLEIETFETRKSDRLDFQDQSAAGLKGALTDAFSVGYWETRTERRKKLK